MRVGEHYFHEEEDQRVQTGCVILRHCAAADGGT